MSAARRLYTYPSLAIAARTRSLVGELICELSRRTRETVARETPLAAATSFIVGRFNGSLPGGGH